MMRMGMRMGMGMDDEDGDGGWHEDEDEDEDGDGDENGDIGIRMGAGSSIYGDKSMATMGRYQRGGWYGGCDDEDNA